MTQVFPSKAISMRTCAPECGKHCQTFLLSDCAEATPSIPAPFESLTRRALSYSAKTQDCGHNARCLLLPDGETLALDAWGHVAVETGDVRHLSPSTVTGVAMVHLRADGPALIKGMREVKGFILRGIRSSMPEVACKSVNATFTIATSWRRGNLTLYYR